MGGVELWDLKEGKRITTFPKTGLIGAIAISPDKQFLIVYDIISYNIQVWNIETKKLEHIFPNCLDNRAIAISSSRKLVAAGCHGEIKLWSLDTGEEIGTLTGHSSYINTLIFSSDGKTLASGSSDETIKLWEIATGKEVHNLSSPGLYSIAISPNGKFLASAGFDSTVRVWKMP